MYGRGMSVRDIQAQLRELYGVEVGHDLISRVTDAVLDDVREWQARPLEDVYPILFLDALIVKVRDGGAVRNRACYVAIGVNLEGERDVLGLWFQQAEGAKFWLAVLNELKQRGVQDVLICCVDGLKGFPEAIEAVFAQAWVQTCIVHLIRQSLRFVPDNHRRQVANDLKPIYSTVDADAAAVALTAFEADWGERYPMIGKTWREAWEHVIPFLAFPPELRRVVYTTNTIEALHRQIRKTIKTRGHFPDRGGRPKTDLPRDLQRQEELATDLQLDVRASRLQDPLRRPTTLTRLHRKSDTLDREVRPSCSRHRATERGEQRPISAARPRPTSLPAQHRRLMAQEQDLELVRATRACKQQHQREQIPHHEIHERPEQAAPPSIDAKTLEPKRVGRAPRPAEEFANCECVGGPVWGCCQVGAGALCS
jgi:putative transposase